ncbi:DUF1361 domain-containing protein [Streptobacillus felis]|uniref:DUF1361 domain-containing protein n=1 Tax=Streptobacillus felis TaxID=1384509 RepID=UPI00082C6918|nr:DUF1361 domain-containing protein [Streptobacillus felis]
MNNRFIKYSLISLGFAVFSNLIYPKYYFLTWNLFLAYVPFFISNIGKKNVIVDSILAFVALIFYPNAVYLFTDLIHISNLKFYKKSIEVVYLMKYINWIKVSLIFIAVIIAMKLSYLAINNYVKKYKMKNFTKYSFYTFVSFLTGLAVFVGRFIRLNSWDLFIYPSKTFNILIEQLNVQNLKYILLYAFIQLFVIILEEE